MTWALSPVAGWGGGVSQHLSSFLALVSCQQLQTLFLYSSTTTVVLVGPVAGVTGQVQEYRSPGLSLRTVWVRNYDRSVNNLSHKFVRLGTKIVNSLKTAMVEIGPRWTNMLPAIIKYSMRRQERKTEIDRRDHGCTLTRITCAFRLQCQLRNNANYNWSDFNVNTHHTWTHRSNNKKINHECEGIQKQNVDVQWNIYKLKE